MTSPPASETLTRSVTIPPPSITAILGAGANGAGGPNTKYCTFIPGPNTPNKTATSLGNEPGCWIYFVLKSGGKSIGPQIDGFTVQENLTRFVVYGMPQGDSDWRPNNPNNANLNSRGPDTGFAYGQIPGGIDYAICDFKCITSFNGVYQLGTILTYTQQNRIMWLDLNGNFVTQNLQTNNWTYIGDVGPTWYLGYQ